MPRNSTDTPAPTTPARWHHADSRTLGSEREAGGGGPVAPGRAFRRERHAVALVESGIQGRVLFMPTGPEQHLAASLEVRMGAGEAGAHLRPCYFSK